MLYLHIGIRRHRLIEQLESRSPSTKDKIANLRRSLEEKIDAHHKTLSKLAPGLQGVDLTPTKAEVHKIYLPSSFTRSEIIAFKLEDMATTECQLRIAHCYDLLQSLRQALGCKSFLLRRVTGPHAERGYKHSTRAQAQIRRAEAVIDLWTLAYKASFSLLLALDPDPADLINLRPLEESDLTMLSNWLEDEAFRDPSTKLSWLWRMTPIDLDGPNSPSSPRFLERVHRWNEEGESFVDIIQKLRA